MFFDPRNKERSLKELAIDEFNRPIHFLEFRAVLKMLDLYPPPRALPVHAWVTQQGDEHLDSAYSPEEWGDLLDQRLEASVSRTQLQ